MCHCVIRCQSFLRIRICHKRCTRFQLFYRIMSVYHFSAVSRLIQKAKYICFCIVLFCRQIVLLFSVCNDTRQSSIRAYEQGLYYLYSLFTLLTRIANHFMSLMIGLNLSGGKYKTSVNIVGGHFIAQISTVFHSR